MIRFYLIFVVLVLFKSTKVRSQLKGAQTTSNLQNLLSPLTNLPSWEDGKPSGPVLTIDSSKTFQTILGFGGAFTEAAAINFYKLNTEDQKKVIRLYFAPPEKDGHGYTIGRVHMNSCDFSVNSYSFDDTDGDQNLEHFDNNVAHDVQKMIPFMHAALAAAPDGIKIFASPWSPPAWMKTNGQMTGSGNPGLKGEDQGAWALYFSKFFDAYKDKGIDLWGLTIQNEPGYAAPWEACLYSAEQERDFLKYHLGPVMRRHHPHVKIMVYDHNKDDVVNWANTIYGDPEAKKYADGMAVHWYSGGQFDHLEQTHNIAPEKFILATEACNCPGVRLRNWDRAHSLAADIMGDLNAWAVGWTDWNLILDPSGGPNHLGNKCDANIIADPGNSLGQGTVIQQVSYYLMGHFSRYLRPGAVRVNSYLDNMGSVSVTAFQHPTQNTTAVVLMNDGGEVRFSLYDSNSDKHAGQIILPANSMMSLMY